MLHKRCTRLHKSVRMFGAVAQCQMYPSPLVQNAMGGSHLHTPQSIFQHMMAPQNAVPQQGRPWMPMPQVPALSIPWSVPALQQPELVRFTGEPSFGTAIHQKRKLEEPDLLETRQTKQFITEEKMAAHFQDMHISPDYRNREPTPSTSIGETELVCPRGVMDLDVPITNPGHVHKGHPKLVLSEELKRLQHEPIIPTSLLSKLERPTMALVLWEPPNKHLRVFPNRDTPTPLPGVSEDNNNEANHNSTNNNNNEAMPDLNEVDVGRPGTSTFEPMEL